MKYNIHLDVYEGPLDLLYEMIAKKKLEIKDISIIEITRQYISFIGELNGDNAESVSEFVAMASKLLSIKSRYLLYLNHEEEEVNPADDLVKQLERYRVFKEASEFIKDSIMDSDNRFYRKKAEILYDDNVDLTSINVEDMLSIIAELFSTEEEEYRELKTFELSEIIKKKNVSLDVKMDEIKEKLSRNRQMTFREMVYNQDKDNVIAAFLCILEMMREKEVEVVQTNFFDGIIIRKLD